VKACHFVGKASAVSVFNYWKLTVAIYATKLNFYKVVKKIQKCKKIVKSNLSCIYQTSHSWILSFDIEFYAIK